MEEKHFRYINFFKYFTIFIFLMSPFIFYEYERWRPKAIIDMDECNVWHTDNNNISKPDIDPNKCLTTCCPPGQVYSYSGMEEGCVYINQSYNIELPVDTINKTKHDLKKDFFYRKYNCKSIAEDKKGNKSENNDWYLNRDDGTIQNIYRNEVHQQHQYCLFVYAPSNESDFHTASLAVCNDHRPTFKEVIIPYLMLISGIALLISFFIHLLVLKRHSLPDKCLLCLLASLTVGVLSFALIQWVALELFCLPVRLIVYYSMLSSFFWMNVRSFDLWWNLMAFKDVHSQQESARRFYYYSLYSFGVPFFITLTAFYIDRYTSIDDKWKIGFTNNETCFIAENYGSQFIYYFGILLLLICINIVFFILTAKRIRNIKMNLMQQLSNDSGIHMKNLQNESAQYTIFLRLFILMGVAWLMEPISFIIDGFYWGFDFTDAVNASQGYYIFLLLIMKRDTLQLIEKRIDHWRGNKEDTSQSSTLTGEYSLNEMK